MAAQSTDIIKIDASNIAQILENPKALGLSHPLIRQIFLLEVLVAGTTHVENIEEVAGDFREGEKLHFFREQNNPHDENAIIVKNKDGKKIGYVPKAKNEILARLMDAGKLVYGLFKEKEQKGKWLKINMQIFLDD
jgi:hypothetical protein